MAFKFPRSGGRSFAKPRPRAAPRPRARTKDKPIRMLLADSRASVRPPSDRAGLPPVGLVQKKQQDRAAEINAPPADEGADREALLRDALRRKAEADANRLQDMIRRNKEYWNQS